MPKGECWKMSAELNSKIGARSYSMGADTRGSEPMAGDESEVPMTQALLEVRSVFGSSAIESKAFVERLSLPSSDGALYSGSRASVVTCAISRTPSDDRFRSCSSWRHGATVMGSNPLKIKSPRILAV